MFEKSLIPFAIGDRLLPWHCAARTLVSVWHHIDWKWRCPKHIEILFWKLCQNQPCCLSMPRGRLPWENGKWNWQIVAVTGWKSEPMNALATVADELILFFEMQGLPSWFKMVEVFAIELRVLGLNVAKAPRPTNFCLCPCGLAELEARRGDVIMCYVYVQSDFFRRAQFCCKDQTILNPECSSDKRFQVKNCSSALNGKSCDPSCCIHCTHPRPCRDTNVLHTIATLSTVCQGANKSIATENHTIRRTNLQTNLLGSQQHRTVSLLSQYVQQCL